MPLLKLLSIRNTPNKIMWIINAQGRFTVRLAYFLQQGVMSRIEISLEEAMEFENTLEKQWNLKILWR